MNDIFKNCEMYYPFVTDDAPAMIDIGYMDLLVETKDGEYYIYNDMARTIRRVARDRHNVTGTEFRKEFGNRLRNIMFLRGLSQNELSERSDISQVTISKYTTGKSVPGFYNLYKIARALGCSVDDFCYL